DPAQPLAVRAPARVRDEVRSADEHLGGRATVSGQAHDLVTDIDRTAPPGWMVLAHARDPLPGGGQRAVGIGIPAWARRLRRERFDAAGFGVAAIKPLIAPGCEPHHSVTRPPGAAAVFVHRGPGVAVLGQQFCRAPVTRPSHECGPPALGGPALRPQHIATVYLRLAQADRPGDDHP